VCDLSLGVALAYLCPSRNTLYAFKLTLES
jgi:hypothetical protein